MRGKPTKGLDNPIEMKCIWVYNVNIKEDYKNDGLHEEDCSICQKHDNLGDFNSFVTSNATTADLVLLAKERGFEFSEKEIEDHADHILPLYDTDVREKIKEDMKKIESELPTEIDPTMLINSTLRTLMARRMSLEKNEETDTKEYATVIDKILKFTELKLKKEGKLQPDNDSRTLLQVNIKDLVLGIGQNGSENAVTTTTDSKDENRQTCGIGIPHKGY